MKLSLLESVSIATVVVGTVWFFHTGAMWQFFPIALAVLIARLANKTTENDATFKKDDKPA
jgi:hypothetical protein